MKLPEDKKERTQILALIGIVAVLALYGLYQGILRGLVAPRQQRRARIETLEGQVREANLVVRQARGDDQRNRDLLEQIQAYSDQHLLVPRLGGNLILGASERIERWFEEAGLERPAIQEIGRRAVEPSAGRDAMRDLVYSYSVRVTFNAGLHAIAHVLKIIEDSDPCVTITMLSIGADSSPPPDALPAHNVSFVIQWPIWRDDDFRNTLKDMQP